MLHRDAGQKSVCRVLSLSRQEFQCEFRRLSVRMEQCKIPSTALEIYFFIVKGHTRPRPPRKNLIRLFPLPRDEKDYLIFVW